MLTEFDQSTMANMTAALEAVCKKIPAESDGHAVRKQLADAMIESANNGRRSFVDFQNAGTATLETILRPATSNGFGWLLAGVPLNRKRR